jgi:7-carboxy-7-deazaguanine synthase
MSAYIIKEIFYTLQGEGLQTGRPAVFCRFSGCNLWSGKQQDRSHANCRFCDTDFVGTDGPSGGVFDDAQTLAQSIAETFPQDISLKTRSLVVLTGGEPALQVDDGLIEALHERDFEIAIETNGTLPLPESIDWITVSPKANTQIIIQSGNELKLVYPQEGTSLVSFEELHFQYFLLQPQDGPSVKENTRRAVDYCLAHPRWRLSLQTHKILGMR